MVCVCACFQDVRVCVSVVVVGGIFPHPTPMPSDPVSGPAIDGAQAQPPSCDRPHVLEGKPTGIVEDMTGLLERK